MGVTIDCGKRTNQIYMNMGKPRVKWAKTSNWRHGVYVHFGPLAGKAGTSPLAYVSIHVGPDILGGHLAALILEGRPPSHLASLLRGQTDEEVWRSALSCSLRRLTSKCACLHAL